MVEQDPERQEPADDEEEAEIEVSDLDVEDETASVTGGMLGNPTAGGEVKRRRP